MWDFLQRYDESWIWRRTERHEVTERSRNFAGREECIADAIGHGYPAPHDKTERAALTRPAERTPRKRKPHATARSA